MSNSSGSRRGGSSSVAGSTKGGLGVAGAGLANGRGTRPGGGGAAVRASLLGEQQQQQNNGRVSMAEGRGLAQGSGSSSGDGSGSTRERMTPLQLPVVLPSSSLLRLGVLSSSLLPSTPASSSSASASGESNAAHTATTLEELQALHDLLSKQRDAADARVRDISRRRDRVLASSSSAHHPPLSTSSSVSLSTSRSKLSPGIPTSSSSSSHKPGHASKPAAPLNASTLGTNNAINNLPSRGVKRGRAPDSASDSSLSPQSVTSISSFEPASSQNVPRATSSRHTSPTVSTAGASVGLGLSSAKLSRTASGAQSKEGSLPPSSSSSTHLPGTPSTSAPHLPKDAKPLAIPGMGAPMPALPGFTKKKKQEKQASPQPPSRNMSPPSEQPKASTSTLPPPPSSLPPRPASLPPKPAQSYGQSSSSSSASLHRREVSATGSASSRDRDRDGVDRQKDRERERERERERSQQKDRDRERERDRRERSISKGKETERDLANLSSSSSSNDNNAQEELKKQSSPQPDSTAASANTPKSDSGIGSSTSSLGAAQPPEPSPRPPDDEPPPPPPLPRDMEVEEQNESKTGNGDLIAPVIAVEDATPTPEPDTSNKEDKAKNESVGSRAASGASNKAQESRGAGEKPASQQGKGRKTLPPSASVATADNTSLAISDSAVTPAAVAAALASESASAPSPRPAAAAASAIPSNLADTPARPSTPLGRKKLPASVTAAASRRASPAPGRDGTPISTAGHPIGQGQSGQIPAQQEGGKTSAGDAEALAALEAKQKRKEEKKKRKLAALQNGSATPTSVGSPKPNGFVNGTSPAIKINGISPSSLRNDAYPPTKMRRVDSATSIDSNDKGGLKVKLNGITLNRPKSTSPGEPAPPVKKGPSIPGVADDFTVPTRSLVPPPPAIHLPAPTPSKQSDINENFDNAKPSTQVPYTSFANWVNDFFRSFGEDDLAFLAPKPEDPGVYDIPPLGPHYQDTWAVMDAELAGEQTDPPPPSTALVPPALRRFKSQNLTTAALPTENMYLGPLGERLISAFKDTKDIRGIMDDLFAAQQEMQSGKAEVDSGMALDSASAVPRTTTGDGMITQTSPQLVAPAMFSDPNVLSTVPSIKEMDALDFESRLTRELSFLGVIPLPTRIAPPPTKPSKKTTESNTTQLDLSSSVDWSSRADDEISTALRACQRQLRRQIAINDKRKERLANIVRQRIAYQEYEHLRDGLEAVIEGAWAKRQRAAQRKAQKDRKEKDKKGDREKDRDKLEAASLAQSIAALNTPQPLSANLVAALTKRRNLVDSVQPLFPPNAYILPTESIYQGLEEEVQMKDV